MRKMALLFAVLLVVATVAPAFATNICVQNAFGQMFRFSFSGMGKGKTVNVRGEFHQNILDLSVNVPFEGAVTLDIDGVTTRIGIISFPSSPAGSFSAVGWSMVGDKHFNATGDYYNLPFSSATPSGSDTWTNVSCSSPFPPASASISSMVEGAPGFVPLNK